MPLVPIQIEPGVRTEVTKTLGGSNWVQSNRIRWREGLVEKFSGAELSSTRMMMGTKMMDHVMKIDGVAASLDPGDKKAMIVTLKAPLGAGTYKLAWHAVAGDTHRSQGSYSFTVK